MWNNLPIDLLAKVFSFLSPDSQAHALSTCRHWHTCANYLAPPDTRRNHPAWFLALPARCTTLSCYAHNPIQNSWHALSLGSAPNPARPLATIGGFILFKHTTTATLQLTICNPFTAQFKHLPSLQIPRTNPAVGLIELDPIHQLTFPNFRVYVAGGMSNMPGGGATYEPTLELYDSKCNTWTVIGLMPVEFSVRLTVWTPNESVYSGRVLYWMTSARAYSIMGFEVGTNNWRELSVPMGDRLEFAAIVPRNGKLTLVGGTGNRDACIWELGEGDKWVMIEKVPFELGVKFLKGKENWGSTKCAGIEGALCLYSDIGSGMVIWRENINDKGKWEWFWVEGCSSVKRKQLQKFPIKGLLLHPNLGFSLQTRLIS